MEDKDTGAIIVGTLAVSMFASLLWLKYRAEPSTQSTATQPAAVSGVPEQPLPAIPVSPTTQVLLRVYDCAVNGQHVYSDQPCDNAGHTRDVMPQNIYEATPFTQSDQTSGTAYDATRQSYTDTPQPVEDCSALEAEVKLIDERMRHGYSEPEGERLRSERRQAAMSRDDCKRRYRLR